jgi:voltage-gated potassium channel
MREKIYNVVHIYKGNPMSTAYKYFMIMVIAISLLPLTTKTSHHFFDITDIVCLVIFAIDYILRWVTADYKYKEKGIKPFIKMPLRLISIVDLLSILALVISIFDMFEDYSFTKALMVFRIIRIFRYSDNIRRITDILKKSKKPLTAVGSLAIGYIVISAIIVFNVEPDTYDSFFDAIYWATVSLTTVGYGDIYPVSIAGRAVAMISSFFGIAIVALPAGIVTAEYINSLKGGD